MARIRFVEISQTIRLASMELVPMNSSLLSAEVSKQLTSGEVEVILSF